jgi:flagellar basal body-associated protein FliL
MDRIQKGIVDSIFFTQGAASTTSGGTDILSGGEVSTGDDADDIKLGLIILGVIALLAILVIAGIIVAVVLIVRNNRKKRQMSAGYQPAANSYPTYQPEPAQKDVFCQNCGTSNSSGSAFCAQCGAKLNDRNSQAQ